MGRPEVSRDTKRRPVPSTEDPTPEYTVTHDAGPAGGESSTPTSPAASAYFQESQASTESGIGPSSDVPPTYTGPSSPTSLPSLTPSITTTETIPGLPPVPFKLYRIPGVELSKDKMTYTTRMAAYSQSPSALLHLLNQHAKLPPHPQIRIQGPSGGSVPHFDIKISMLPYLVRPPDARGTSGWQYIRVLADNELGWRGGKQEDILPAVKGGLEEWVNRYIMEEIKDKTFMLTKQVTNWDTDYLEGQIRSLVATTGYKGKLTITFPVTHSSLIVQGPSDKKIWYEAIADVFKAKATRRYAVVSAYWPYAALTTHDASGQGNAWAVKSEKQFWSEWKDVLKAAVLEGRRGWVSMEDHIEWAMGTGWEHRKQTRTWSGDNPHT